MLALQRCIQWSEHLRIAKGSLPWGCVSWGLQCRRRVVLPEHTETQSLRKHTVTRGGFCFLNLWFLWEVLSRASPRYSHQKSKLTHSLSLEEGSFQSTNISWVTFALYPEAHLNWLDENGIHFLSQGMLFFWSCSLCLHQSGHWSSYGKGAHWCFQFSFSHCCVASRPVPQQIWYKICAISPKQLWWKLRRAGVLGMWPLSVRGKTTETQLIIMSYDRERPLREQDLLEIKCSRSHSC